LKKNEKQPSDLRCNVVRVEVVLKEWVWEKMVPKHMLHGQGLNYETNVYELKDQLEKRDGV